MVAASENGSVWEPDNDLLSPYEIAVHLNCGVGMVRRLMRDGAFPIVSTSLGEFVWKHDLATFIPVWKAQCRDTRGRIIRFKKNKQQGAKQ